MDVEAVNSVRRETRNVHKETSMAAGLQRKDVTIIRDGPLFFWGGGGGNQIGFWSPISRWQTCASINPQVFTSVYFHFVLDRSKGVTPFAKLAHTVRNGDSKNEIPIMLFLEMPETVEYQHNGCRLIFELWRSFFSQLSVALPSC